MSELCRKLEHKLVELVGPAGLDPAERDLLLAHAAECRRCAALLAESERALEILRRSAPLGPSAASEQGLRDQARAALAAQRRQRTVWVWSRGLAVAASLVLVAGLGLYLLEREPIAPTTSRRSVAPLGPRAAAPAGPAPAAAPEARAAPPASGSSAATDGEKKERASKLADRVADRAPAAAPTAVVAEAGSQPAASFALPPPPPAALAKPKPAISRMESDAEPPPCDESLADEACSPVVDGRTEPPAGLMAPAESFSAAGAQMESTAAPEVQPPPRGKARVAESSGFAARADRGPALPCDELEARARRLAQNAAERAPLLLATADCLRAQRPTQSAALYLEAAQLDPELGAAVRQRLVELLGGGQLSPSSADQIRRWLEAH